MTEDEMVGWHHPLNGHEFEHAPGVGDGQGSLANRFRGLQRVKYNRATQLIQGAGAISIAEMQSFLFYSLVL